MGAVLSNTTYRTLMIVNLSLFCVSEISMGLAICLAWVSPGRSLGVLPRVSGHVSLLRLLAVRIHCQQFQDWLLSSLAFQGTLFLASRSLLQSQAWGPFLF